MTEQEIAGLVKAYLEETLEPQIRETVESGDIASQKELDDALFSVVLRRLIEQWENALKEELGYDYMPEVSKATESQLEQESAEEEERVASMTPEEREQVLAEFQDEHPEYVGMNVEEIFAKMRKERGGK